MSLDLNWIRTPIDTKCLYCFGEYFYNLPNLVVHLNDVHRWSREKIADYIEQFEKSESPKEIDELQVAAK